MFELRKISLDVTNACNLRCKHCSTNSGMSLENELSLEDINRILSDIYQMGVFEVQLSERGEPFSRPDILDILEMINSKDFSMQLLTNGLLLTETIAKKLSEFDIRCIQIPIEGLKDEHEYLRGRGTFDPAINAVRLLKNYDLNVQVRMTVTKRSLKDIEPLSCLLAKLDVDKFLITEFIPIGRGFVYKDQLMLNSEEKKELQKSFVSVRNKYKNKLLVRGGAYGCFEGNDEINKIGILDRSALCGALRGDWCDILPDGTVTPCDLIHFYAGNIHLQHIDKIWAESLVLKSFREFNMERLEGSCGSCSFKTACGGCRALAFLFNGNFYKEDPMCGRSCS